MKVTQKDIAKKLGVSTSLVSRVLSGRAEEIGIRKEIIDEVQNLAKKLNYVPSSAALSLKGKKSSTIGVIVYDFNDPFFSKVIGELQKIVQEENFSMLLVGFMNRALTESSLRPLYKHNVDGIIVVGSFGDMSWTSNFPDIPIARIGHGDDERLTLRIAVDENLAMKNIARHLVEQKVSKVAFARRNVPVHANREAAFLNSFLADRHFKKPFSCFSMLDDEFDAGQEIAERLLKDGLPEAIVCASDLVAMGVISCLSQKNVKIPEDVLVTGFDNIASASYFVPSITTYRQNIATIAQYAFESVAKDGERGCIDVEGELLIRKSSKR